MGVSVEIICVLSQKDAQAAVEQRFNETGDLLLARILYEELDRVLLAFRLLPTTDIQECTTYLQNALQQSTIESYEYVVSTLVSVSLKPVPDRETQMRDFPLASGDAWFPALDDPQKVYLSIDVMPMTNEQITWLREHQANWKYEDW
ncbi:MAG TPA: hypothetical protein VIZ18_08585 [Ktedonobacteraceae bacterium]